jgi:hypothetical protein
MALHLKSTGIDFADFSGAGGMSSELLDDYEEGTWTPAFQFQNATSESSKNFASQTGSYVKVGQHVTASVVVTGTWSGGNADNVNTNIPFVKTNTGGAHIMGFGTASGTAAGTVVSGGNGVNSAQFLDGEGTGNFTQFLTQSNTFNVGLTLVYRTT